MAKISFDQTLDAIDALTSEQQADLLQIMSKRLSDKLREQVLADIQGSRAEHKAGLTKTGSPDEIMREIESCDED